MATYKINTTELKKLSLADLIACYNWASQAYEEISKRASPEDQDGATYFETLESACSTEISARTEKILPSTPPDPSSGLKIYPIPRRKPRI